MTFRITTIDPDKSHIMPVMLLQIVPNRVKSFAALAENELPKDEPRLLRGWWLLLVPKLGVEHDSSGHVFRVLGVLSFKDVHFLFGFGDQLFRWFDYIHGNHCLI